LQVAPIGGVAVSSVTQAELLYGAVKRAETPAVAERVDEFLARVRVFAWDEAAARQYATIRGRCEAKGVVFHPFDLMAFAHAAALAGAPGAELLFATGLKGLPRVPGLKVEDWTKEASP
jgi:tRNA(fMet)-specific endonuclease VapC